ncbi:hypothetical protein K2173_023465 [Erythroxylum novogranatense]|uniref:Integrase catalytic domain-containing protein n=1 Tax=Erythroxylum novogranatense TaxID=1862640 RepID=A0AAV8TY72_9ROSI|nr:hypothetical protein K2173_023465 [Erythroxylum novogranatense]
MLADKMMGQGCEAFLAHIVDADVHEGKLEDFPIVREFPDVFPDELPGLPPVREIEFAIDLIPGTAPISIPPYRMAPAELRELKEQLEELLEKGYVRPSSSPWGAPVLFVKKKDGSWRYYRRFVEGFSMIASLMTKLLRKNQKFIWTDECQKSFEELKHRLTSAPVLILPSGDEGYTVYSDASRKGKANVVADALSRKSSIAHVQTVYLPLLEEMAKLRKSLEQEEPDCLVATFRVRPILREKVRELQAQDAELSKLRQEIQNVKAEHQAPLGKLRPLSIPEWKWQRVTMDILMGLPKTSRKHDAIWVIVDRLTKSAHFLAIKQTDSLHVLARKYIDEIVRSHGISDSIVSDRDPRFTSRF